MENRAPSWDSLHALIDLCAGFGVLSQGIAAGFEVAVPRMMELYAKVSDAPQLRGDFGNQEFCMRFGRKQVGHQPFHPDLAVSRTHAWVMGKVAMTSGPIAYPKHWQQRFPPDQIGCPGVCGTRRSGWICQSRVGTFHAHDGLQLFPG